MLHNEEIGTLGQELMKAGLHVGKGKGALLVRRHDVEKAFLKLKREHPSETYYSADVIANIVQRAQNLKTDIKRNVAIHITKMYKRGLLERIKVGRDFRYRAKKSFTKLSNTQRKSRHPARGKPVKVKVTSVKKLDPPSPPLQKKSSFEGRLHRLADLADRLEQMSADILEEYQDMKKQLEKII